MLSCLSCFKLQKNPYLISSKFQSTEEIKICSKRRSLGYLIALVAGAILLGVGILLSSSGFAIAGVISITSGGILLGLIISVLIYQFLNYSSVCQQGSFTPASLFKPSFYKLKKFERYKIELETLLEQLNNVDKELIAKIINLQEEQLREKQRLDYIHESFMPDLFQDLSNYIELYHEGKDRGLYQPITKQIQSKKMYETFVKWWQEHPDHRRNPELVKIETEHLLAYVRKFYTFSPNLSVIKSKIKALELQANELQALAHEKNNQMLFVQEQLSESLTDEELNVVDVSVPILRELLIERELEFTKALFITQQVFPAEEVIDYDENL
ncbi:hypothetical protein CLAVI_000438 [Candidatus Clavichlamydia salmonicola]|uniref:hypothetical protein n=1 Tax=Candidatus Clavichlamydia salmonicola TaxID=469812 RepID=UPI0018910D73|nr:hypothetical protein [Candidatus Clavichlamydia salmonicola]MBF5050819.1 hypothetical protein [Candidatus Clavichlamydia salmonicola]